MTMPTLVQKHQEKVTVTKLKKVYSVLNQAYQRAQVEHGTIDGWQMAGISDFNGHDDDGRDNYSDNAYQNEKIFWEKLIPFMNVTQKCFSVDNDCTESFETYRLHGLQTTLPVKKTIISLNDGMQISGGWFNNFSNCKTCGDFYVDINGFSVPPNTIGKDVFYFGMTKTNIVPIGTPTYPSRQFPAECKRNGTSNANGYACAAWVIYNENMDYLHCDDLSWNGKKKCK